MVELSSEEESALHELLENREDAESVHKFIENRLYHELSHVEKYGGYDVRVPHSGYKEQAQIYESLVAKGLLVGDKPSGASFYWYEDLTSDGRCFFIDRDARRKAEEERLRAEHRHDWRIALFGIIGGLFSGAFGSWLLNAILAALP